MWFLGRIALVAFCVILFAGPNWHIIGDRLTESSPLSQCQLGQTLIIYRLSLICSFLREMHKCSFQTIEII